MFHLLKCQLKSRLPFSCTHFVALSLCVSLCIGIAGSGFYGPCLFSFHFNFSFFKIIILDSHLKARGHAVTLIPIQSKIFFSFISSVLDQKLRQQYLTMKLSLQASVCHLQMASHRPSHFMSGICCS